MCAAGEAPPVPGTGAPAGGFQLPAFLQQGFSTVGQRLPAPQEPSRPDVRTLNAQQPQQPSQWLNPANFGGGGFGGQVRDPWAARGKGHKLGSSSTS
jgi:hypothetical protein